MKKFLLTLGLTGCALIPHARQEKIIPLVETLADTYASLQPPGWTDTAECDALEFNSLRAASGVAVNPGEAEDPGTPGRWYRRPVGIPECYATGASFSTISRDMLLGVYWWAWSTGNTQVIHDLWEYGATHNWVMGSGRLQGADTLLNPNMIALLGRLCVKTGADCSGNPQQWAEVPLVYTGGSTGFTRHLETLQILLLGEMDGKLPEYLVEVVRGHALQQPDNPLFAVGLVLYDRLDPTEVDRRLQSWPSDRLPTNEDWCSSWRTESEAPGPVEPNGSRGWNACPGGETVVHSGGEVLFLRRLLHGREG